MSNIHRQSRRSLGTQDQPETKLSPLNCDLELFNQPRNIYVVVSVPPSQILGQSVKGFIVMIGHTQKQTNIDYNFTDIPCPIHCIKLSNNNI